MPPRAHSIIGASKAKVWMNCPGSVALCQQVSPKPPSVAMSEGTAAHGLAELVLNEARPSAFAFMGVRLEADGRWFTVDDEMAEAVQEYVDVVRARIVGGSFLFVEKSFALPHLHPELHGTNDSGLVLPRLRGYVWDLKYGKGNPVPADNNHQLMIYALGLVGEGNPYGLKEMVMTIVQPRVELTRMSQERRTFVLPVRDLSDWGNDVLKPAAAACFEPGAPCRYGSWCVDCQAGGLCPVQAKQSLAEAAVLMPDIPDGAITVPEVRALSTAQLMQVWRSADLVEDYISAVRARVNAEVELGNPEIPYKFVTRTEGKLRNWKVEEQAVLDALSPMLGSTDPLFNSKLVSPAQAVEALKGVGYTKKDADEIIADLVDKRLKEPKRTLVPKDDARVGIDSLSEMPELE